MNPLSLMDTLDMARRANARTKRERQPVAFRMHLRRALIQHWREFLNPPPWTRTPGVHSLRPDLKVTRLQWDRNAERIGDPGGCKPPIRRGGGEPASDPGLMPGSPMPAHKR